MAPASWGVWYIFFILQTSTVVTLFFVPNDFRKSRALAFMTYACASVSGIAVPCVAGNTIQYTEYQFTMELPIAVYPKHYTGELSVFL